MPTNAVFNPDRSRAVAVWLAVVALLVVLMVVVGGATRLTGSGLSITEWKPISGTLPPMTDAAWQAEFAAYRQIPQYKLVNAGMSLDEFKGIFWWEWGHRLLGRVIGLAFALPFVVFLIRRQVPRWLIGRCVGLFLLGGLQGAVGWWMVASGLTERISVAPERLMTHLGLAFFLLVALVWTALDAWYGRGEARRDRWTRAGAGFLGLVFVQALLGALVAGNDAGMVMTDWPKMGGKWWPDGYAGHDLWHTIAHNIPSVQLHHRIGGYVVALVAAGLVWRAWRERGAERSAVLLTGAVTAVQVLLGIAALVMAVPLWLGILHQLGAALLLAAATLLAWRVRRA